MSKLDFISRSELLAEIDRERKRHIDSGNYGAEHLTVHSLRRLVEDAHAVDAAPVVHGRWGWREDYRNYAKTFRCSACKSEIDMPYYTRGCDYDFCPNCGAKMDKEE